MVFQVAISFKLSSSYITFTQASGDIEEHFESPIMERRLLVFTDDGALSQMMVCAENEELFEVPGETLLEGIMHLMAAYYVYNVEYPRGCKGLLYFFQDILMERSGSGKRPTRYKTFINRL